MYSETIKSVCMDKGEVKNMEVFSNKIYKFAALSGLFPMSMLMDNYRSGLRIMLTCVNLIILLTGSYICPINPVLHDAFDSTLIIYLVHHVVIFVSVMYFVIYNINHGEFYEFYRRLGNACGVVSEIPGNKKQSFIFHTTLIYEILPVIYSVIYAKEATLALIWKWLIHISNEMTFFLTSHCISIIELVYSNLGEELNSLNEYKRVNKKSLQKLRKMHLDLIEIVSKFNKLYGLQMLITIVVEQVSIFRLAFYMNSIVKGNQLVGNLSPIYIYIYLSLMAGCYFLKMNCLAVGSTSAERVAARTIQSALSIETPRLDVEAHEELNFLIEDMAEHRFGVTASGCFKIENQMLYSVFEIFFSYIVIVITFNLTH